MGTLPSPSSPESERHRDIATATVRVDDRSPPLDALLEAYLAPEQDGFANYDHLPLTAFGAQLCVER